MFKPRSRSCSRPRCSRPVRSTRYVACIVESMPILMKAQTKDKYEQECLKIKGYLAQGHMVMGQEERRNKAKLEKTQISLVTSNTEYENAVKILDETTGRWNREWKAAADKFQDLEEERLDFTKGSLWTFANIASTVCVSDDSSCEKIRLSLEKMEVEKDILTFINERGTGQEIPDAPRYVNFCRGDNNDAQSEVSEEDNYSVAQFPRSINPAFRSASPQPSTFESHHDPNSALANTLAHRDGSQVGSREATLTPQKQPGPMQPSQMQHAPMRASMEDPYQRMPPAQVAYDAGQHGPVSAVPHDPYPMDGMTMLCRTGPPSDRNSHVSSARPSSRDSRSEYSNPTSFSSQEPPSPIKQDPASFPSPEKRVLKKKSGFFQNHSPFRRKSTKEAQNPVAGNRNSWHVSSQPASSSRPQLYGQEQPSHFAAARSASPEPIDANATLALGVGQNVLPITTPDSRRGERPLRGAEDNDPIALALAELKEVTMSKPATNRVSADHYSGMATPAPGSESIKSRSVPALGARDAAAATRGTPPPSYQNQGAPVSRLGVPPPAVTSRAMKEATKKVTSHTRDIFGEGGRGNGSVYGTSPSSRPATRGSDMPRAASPAATRSVSPQPQMSRDSRRMDHRSASPNPYGSHEHRNSSQTSFQPRSSDQGYHRQTTPNEGRGGSASSHRGDYNRPRSSYGGNADMSVQLAPAGDEHYGSQRGRSSGTMGLYEEGSRQRSKSVADPSRQYTRDGRPILHFGECLSDLL